MLIHIDNEMSACSRIIMKKHIYVQTHLKLGKLNLC
jgi:hypothetical protein